MLSLFRTNQIAFNLLLIVYILILRGSAFFVDLPSQNLEGHGVLSDWVYSLVGSAGIGANVVSILLVFIQALLINIIVAKFRMDTSVSLFPGLFYVLFASLFPEFLALSPVLMANTFFILAIWELFETYRKSEASGNIVNVGFWIGTASLFYFSEIWFILLGLAGMNILRAFRLKEVLMLVIGFSMPFILTVVYYFWYGQLGIFWSNYIPGHFSFFSFGMEGDLQNYIKLGVLVLICLVIFFSFNGYYSKRNIHAQKNISCLLWALFIAGLMVIFRVEIQFHHFLAMMVPAGILLSFNFLKMKATTAEAIHLLLFVGVLIWQFVQ